MPSRRNDRAVGIEDVARAAGVSITTVSHAFSGRGQVAQKTRARILQVAEDLGYAPNRLASSLRTRRSNILGFISDDIATTPYATRVVLGGQEAAAERDQLLVVVNSNRDAAIELDQLTALMSAQVDGIVYARMFHQEATSLPPQLGRVPTALLDTSDPEGNMPSAVPDEVQIGRLATETLLRAGHTEIVHLTISEPGSARDGRIAGYSAAMRAAGQVPRIVTVPEPADARAGRAVFAEMTQGPAAAATGVFAFNDPMAMGVYQVAVRGGIRVPEELSVVGVDDFEPVAASLLPGLTTVALPHYEMGRWGVETVLAMLDGDEVPHLHRLLRGTLVERESVAPPR
ncbi:LacI family DNA-binding transcriptional regulator [uncultured Microbacterium sp.]|uniref:LacI family DNA-binding transcriptional regulator n=1 Tax=uncultured Microbacterium sp. TaxID=191216 RepID=UPI0025F9F086|nr:LacI family DNA-binding transcriptional regulator [uncultured Microbacterium sp.]